jgi:hypothetical protein
MMMQVKNQLKDMLYPTDICTYINWGKNVSTDWANVLLSAA